MNIYCIKALGQKPQESIRSTRNNWRSASLTDDDNGWKFSGRGSKSMRVLSGSGSWRNNYSGMDYSRLIKKMHTNLVFAFVATDNNIK